MAFLLAVLLLGLPCLPLRAQNIAGKSGAAAGSPAAAAGAAAGFQSPSSLAGQGLAGPSLVSLRDGLVASLERIDWPAPALERLRAVSPAEPALLSHVLVSLAAELRERAEQEAAGTAEASRLMGMVSALAQIHRHSDLLRQADREALESAYAEAGRARTDAQAERIRRIAVDLERTAAALGSSSIADETGYPDAAARLKAETKGLHALAQKHPFQRGLLKATKRSDYQTWLGQMLLVHSALEARLKELRPSVPELSAVIKDHQFQEPNLRADLKTLSVDADGVSPLPAVREFASLVDRAMEDPARAPFVLLGMHYVLEGSKNGSHFIAIAVRLFLRLKHGSGDRYMDPYGSRQKELWGAFKADLARVKLDADQAAALVAGASAMFMAVIRLNDDLQAQKLSTAPTLKRRWLPLATKFAFLFFLIKGLIWLALAAAAWFGFRSL